MYQIDHRTLATLPNDAARALVQRWAEMTHDATHPEWRLRPLTPSAADLLLSRLPSQVTNQHPRLASVLNRLKQTSASEANSCELLLSAVSSNDVQETLRLAPIAATDTLLSDHPRRWQHVTVLSYLLDPDGKWSTTKPFDERLREFTGMVPAVPTSACFEAAWHITADLPAHAKLPWLNPTLHGRGPNQPPILIKEQKVGGKRSWYLSVEATEESLVNLARIASHLRTSGFVWLSLLRLAFPDVDFRPCPQLIPQGSTTLRPLPGDPPPKLWDRRESRRRLGELLNFLNAHQTADVSLAIVGSLNWLSCAMRHWSESPVFATSVLWIALESLYSGCVYEHIPRCSRATSHSTGLELYLASLPEVLADEVEEYVLRIGGTAQDRAMGRRKPPDWWFQMPNRAEVGTLCWIKEIVAILRREPSSDPLLLHRVQELVTLFECGDLSEIYDARQLDLELLHGIRHVIAHTGQIVLDEGLAGYLSVLAVEVLKAGLHEPARL